MIRADLGNPQWELIDPTPNVHALFVQFDEKFFGGRLRAGAVAVRWSKRMYSCAGICRYEGGSGMCDVALSEPLLKLRPRKDLVETLLHEMIHAFLFVAEADRDRDGHGPNFQRHMHRINTAANLNISIYHSFHDEVRLYQTHWWRCNGPCQAQKPYFGIVRRTCNRAPGPSDFWWAAHQAKCGGQFVKFKEPEKKEKSVLVKNKAPVKPKESIKKYIDITGNINTLSDINSTGINNKKAMVPDKNLSTTISASIDQNQNTVNSKWVENLTGNTLKSSETKKVDENVLQTVRNHWANKGLPNSSVTTLNSNNNKKRAAVEDIAGSPPFKIKKIDKYFPSLTNPPENFTKDEAESMLKDIYGENFTLYQTNEKNSTTPPKLVPVATPGPSSKFVSCPACDNKVIDSEINDHLDKCLNGEEGAIDLTDDISLKKTRDCPVCNVSVSESLEDHLEICLKGFENQDFAPDNPSTSKSGQNIIETVSLITEDIDDDIDESRKHNASGTMHPCPCCLAMVEADLMNVHIDECLNNIYIASLTNED